MVLKLYGTNISPPSRYAGLVLLEMKVPFELVNVDLGKREQKSPENLANQPFGQIPYIVEDDGFILYESRAIARYIATKYANQGPKLIPTGDLKKIAKFEQATFAESAHFYDPAFSLLLEIFVKKMQGLTPDEARVKDLKTTLLSKMDVYEQILSKQKYIAGDEITLADIAHLPLASVMPDIGIDITTGRPNLTKWLNELFQRESWQTMKANGLVSTA